GILAQDPRCRAALTPERLQRERGAFGVTRLPLQERERIAPTRLLLAALGVLRDQAREQLCGLRNVAFPDQLAHRPELRLGQDGTELLQIPACSLARRRLRLCRWDPRARRRRSRRQMSGNVRLRRTCDGKEAAKDGKRTALPHRSDKSAGCRKKHPAKENNREGPKRCLFRRARCAKRPSFRDKPPAPQRTFTETAGKHASSL